MIIVNSLNNVTLEIDDDGVIYSRGRAKEKIFSWEEIIELIEKDE